MQKPVIVEAIRTPVGKFNGRLKDVRPDELLGFLLQELFARTTLAPSLVDELIVGCVDQVGEQSTNVARNAWLAAGLPATVPAFTLDYQCGSSQTAVNVAAAMVAAGVRDIVIAGGVESMTRVPFRSNREVAGTPWGSWYRMHYPVLTNLDSAEQIATQWRLDRAAMDDFAYNSHLRAARAIKEGRFAREIVRVPLHHLANTDEPCGEPLWFAQDEGVRMEPDREKMSTLAPVSSPDGRITAGNASQISDGAAILLIMSRERALSLGYRPRAWIRAQKSVAVSPELMLHGPIPASQQLLKDVGMSIDEIDLYEVNEAFASVAMAWQQELKADPERLNVNGGGIALGHPLGATGARLMTTMLHEMERRNARFGLQAMCCGGGLGVATLLDREV